MQPPAPPSITVPWQPSTTSDNPQLWRAAEPSELRQQLWSVTSRSFDELSRYKGSCETQEKLGGIRVGNTLMTHIHTDFLSRASLVAGVKHPHWSSSSDCLMFGHSTHAQHFETPKCQCEEEEGDYSFWKCHGINIFLYYSFYSTFWKVIWMVGGKKKAHPLINHSPSAHLLPAGLYKPWLTSAKHWRGVLC